MHGTLHFIPSIEGALPWIEHLSTPPSADRLARIIGGEAKLVEGFDSILRDGDPEPCFVFCNENASRKELAHNAFANMLWLQALVRAFGFAGCSHQESTRGPVAIIFGDAEFLNGVLNAASHNSSH